MSDGYGIQVSYKLGPDQDMVNVRGNDADEFTQNLIALSNPDMAKLIAQVRHNLAAGGETPPATPAQVQQAVNNVNQAFPQTQEQQPPPWAGVVQQHAQATGAPMCQHGIMQARMKKDNTGWFWSCASRSKPWCPLVPSQPGQPFPGGR